MGRGRHKPAYSYFYPLADGTLSTKPSGLDAVSDLAGRDAFWSIIEQYDASYFCGHEHIYDVRQPRAASGGHAWQVIVGSGGRRSRTVRCGPWIARTPMRWSRCTAASPSIFMRSRWYATRGWNL